MEIPLKKTQKRVNASNTQTVQTDNFAATGTIDQSHAGQPRWGGGGWWIRYTDTPWCSTGSAAWLSRSWAIHDWTCCTGARQLSTCDWRNLTDATYLPEVAPGLRRGCQQRHPCRGQEELSGGGGRGSRCQPHVSWQSEKEIRSHHPNSGGRRGLCGPQGGGVVVREKPCWWGACGSSSLSQRIVTEYERSEVRENQW